MQALRNIEAGPARHGSTARPEILIEGARTYHIRFSRDLAKSALGVLHNPRHLVLYRHREDRNAIDIARILHDGRDLPRHLPEEYRRTGTEEN